MRTTNLARLPMAVLLVLCALLAVSMASAEEVTYQNDGWVENIAAGFQGGFVSGEIGAAVFVPEATDYPVQLTKVRFLFGGGDEGSMREVGIKVWKDTGGDSPGELLMDETVQITSSTNSFNEVDLSSAGISITEGSIRVGVAFMHDGFPGVARDDDPGADFPNRNFIFAQGIGWVKSNLLGVNGDWVIRLIGQRAGGTVTNNGNPPDCVNDGDCGRGEICDAGMCVPDGCTADRDCLATEACIRSSCVAVDCHEDSDCQDGEECTSNLECRPVAATNNGAVSTGLSISSITPSSAANDKDTDVTIVGQGFSADTSFRVGPTRLSNVLVQSDSAALATVPAGIAPGVYNVVANRGAEQFSLDQGFIVEEAAKGGSGGSSDGCQVAPGTSNGVIGLILALATGLFVARRRP